MASKGTGQAPHKQYQAIRGALGGWWAFYSGALAQISTSVPANVLENIAETCAHGRQMLATAIAIPNIDGIAQVIEQDPAYTPTVEWAATRSAMSALGAAIVSNFPKDANGVWLAYKRNATTAAKEPETITLTAGQVTALTALVQAVVDSIE